MVPCDSNKSVASSKYIVYCMNRKYQSNVYLKDQSICHNKFSLSSLISITRAYLWRGDSSDHGQWPWQWQWSPPGLCLCPHIPSPDWRHTDYTMITVVMMLNTPLTGSGTKHTGPVINDNLITGSSQQSSLPASGDVWGLCSLIRMKDQKTRDLICVD